MVRYHQIAQNEDGAVVLDDVRSYQVGDAVISRGSLAKIVAINYGSVRLVHVNIKGEIEVWQDVVSRIATLDDVNGPKTIWPSRGNLSEKEKIKERQAAEAQLAADRKAAKQARAALKKAAKGNKRSNKVKRADGK